MAQDKETPMFDIRTGETALVFDPAALPPDGHVVFIGQVRSPWVERKDCPKNMAEARERRAPATIVLDAEYRAGLLGLEAGQPIALLTWLHHAPRNLIVQTPRHAPEAKGVFALRSPVRPNPIGLHVAMLTGIDREAGLLELDGIDVLDGTPVIDIKPFLTKMDSVSQDTSSTDCNC